MRVCADADNRNPSQGLERKHHLFSVVGEQCPNGGKLKESAQMGQRRRRSRSQSQSRSRKRSTGGRPGTHLASAALENSSNQGLLLGQ